MSTTPERETVDIKALMDSLRDADQQTTDDR